MDVRPDQRYIKLVEEHAVKAGLAEQTARRAHRVAGAALIVGISSMIMIIVLYVLYYTYPAPVKKEDETPADGTV